MPNQAIKRFMHVQAFKSNPTGQAAEDLLARVLPQTEIANQCSALYYIRASLQLQLGRFADAADSVQTLFKQLAGAPHPCWVHAVTIQIAWCQGELDQVKQQLHTCVAACAHRHCCPDTHVVVSVL